MSLLRKDDVARCLRCGHTVSIAALRAATLSARAISDITKPPGRL